MKTDKYQLLLNLTAYNSQLNSLAQYCLESCECYSLLQQKLDELCHFIINTENESIWKKYASCTELDRQVKQLRETAIRSLCCLERHQAKCVQSHQLNITPYIRQLKNNIKEELTQTSITSSSKVLFIGSGSFPLSVFTISKMTGATILGLDIDDEAVKLASDLHKNKVNVSFVHGELTSTFKSFMPSHIILASLVEHKWEVLAHLHPFLTSTEKVLVRYGNGLKSAFNYPFNPDISIGWKSNPITKPAGIYDAVLMEKY